MHDGMQALSNEAQRALVQRWKEMNPADRPKALVGLPAEVEERLKEADMVHQMATIQKVWILLTLFIFRDCLGFYLSHILQAWQQVKVRSYQHVSVLQVGPSSVRDLRAFAKGNGERSAAYLVHRRRRTNGASYPADSTFHNRMAANPSMW